MDDAGPAGLWAHGAAYEAYVGRWSRLLARECLAWMAAPPGGRWLDVGCGTGVLSETILASASPAEVCGIDRSEPFISHARARVADPRARFQVGDAMRIPFETGTFDAAASGLVLNFVPDAGGAVAEIARVVRPGGLFAAYVWDYGGQMQMMRRFWDAAVELDPGAAQFDEGRRFGISHPDRLRTVAEQAGFGKVATRAIDITTRFRDFDDYWTPFLGGVGPAPTYALSLTEDRRAVLRERIRGTLLAGPNGAIELLARAWAVRGVAGLKT
jgi:SAM-dependent methyltransferase